MVNYKILLGIGLLFILAYFSSNPLAVYFDGMPTNPAIITDKETARCTRESWWDGDIMLERAKADIVKFKEMGYTDCYINTDVTKQSTVDGWNGDCWIAYCNIAPPNLEPQNISNPIDTTEGWFKTLITNIYDWFRRLLR